MPYGTAASRSRPAGAKPFRGQNGPERRLNNQAAEAPALQRGRGQNGECGAAIRRTPPGCDGDAPAITAVLHPEPDSRSVQTAER
ncbi:hypothetical protein GCM10027440_54060 [Nocardiopsis coralliicola]